MLSKNQGIVVVFTIFLLILGVMQFTVPYIIGFDGYYNIKTADIIKKEGFIKEFSWVEHSILSENYADIQILFRILHIPFTFFGLELGAKIASILFAAIAFVVFYWFLIENKIKYAFFWTLLYLFTTESLMYRFMLPRQMPLVIALLILTIYFLQRKKYLFLGITSLIFVLLHSSFIFQILIIILYFTLEKIFSKKFDYKILLYSSSGIILGLVINPYFPNNIFMLYTQIVEVNLIANLFNVEWKPWDFFEFIKNNFLVLIYLSIAIFILFKEKTITKNKTLYFSLAVFFFAYTILSRRMQEFLVPFSILALALFLNNHLERFNKDKFLKHFKVIGIILLLIIAVGNFVLLRQDIIGNNFLFNYENCANWMSSNVPKNSLIFINAYAFPYLFFKNSNIRYTHGLDLTYSYLYNPDEFKRYMGILRGTIKDDVDWIVQDYEPDYVFAGKVEQDVQLFDYIIKNKKNYKAVYEDKWCAVLEVR